MHSITAARLAIAFVGLAVLAGAFFIIGPIAQASYRAAPASQYSAGYNPDAPLAPRAIGIPATHPRASLAGESGPAFTVTDVEQWVNTRSTYTSGGMIPVVDSVEFMTSAQVSSRLRGENTGMPDDALLCFVVVQGTFASSGPVIPGQTPTVNHYQTGYLVFDAHTGNLIMSSV